MEEKTFEDMINTIQLGDCYELIKKIPDKSIDLVYIDIPYLFTHGKGGSGSLSKRVNRLMSEELIKVKDGINYEILNDFIRVLKNINIFIWCNKNQILDILEYFKNQEVSYEILTWNKTNPIPMTDNTWLQDIEYCLYFKEKGKIKLNPGYELKSKWYISPLNKSDKDLFNHPTIKPLDLVKRHILHSTQPNDIVLDCFCGSGTTCVAAKETGRRFIGMEIDPEYHKIAVNRVNGIEASGQMTLMFDDKGELLNGKEVENRY